ncbi:potassium channel family protein [Domibacillus epiphyticus]|uniref:Potassium uptake system protein n=1 Tax=Domibacillus epiphyticus TaxID=1714355 RepID=A0A1V2A7R6_9BACI|nr:TrkA family potassium uptake protein [Domibacillus epiphyticus]OMP67006.1 potassium uptake system protein [Domibacillus epiphyticus]
MTRQQYAVIGMGRFGSSVAKQLYDAGQEVMGIDIEEKQVEDAELFITHGAVADTTVKATLKSLGIRNVDCVIVAIGSNMQASILTVLLLKEIGIKKVIAKALNEQHGQVLEKVGADWIVYPDKDMGERVAHQLLSPNVINFIELSKEYSIEEINIPENMVGKSLRELDIRANYNVSVIAVMSHGDILISPSSTQTIHKGDILIVIGKKQDLSALTKEE